MVFTVAEDANQPDQASVLLKGKQRRHCLSARKSKGTSNVASSKAKDSFKTGTKSNRSSLTENEMGNTSAHASKNGPPSIPLEQATGILVLEKINCDKKPVSTDMVGDQPSAAQACLGAGDDGEVIITEDNLAGGQVTCPNIAPEEGEQSEITKLKQLLMLQVSLISRQQDLLRLRDREIMQLKASNANYKCQLSRVRRRMSKRKSDADDSPKSSKRRLSENPADFASSSSIEMLDTATPFVQTPSASQLLKSNHEGQKSRKRRLKYQENLAELPSESLALELSKSTTDTSGPMGSLFSPENDAVPVPVAFIEQKQAELIHAMMASPPDKALKTFYDITSSSPHLDELPFKICDRCPHCVMIAQDLIRLFKAAETPLSERLGETPVKDITPVDKEMLNLAGIVFPPIGVEGGDSIAEENKLQIMRTSRLYHRIPPTFDQNHWWWDLKCDGIKSESALKIPTWQERETAPLTPGSGEDEVAEATDDSTFTDRHTKLEQDEKRRKRWDIQRIREYRYNEKLRQKLLKQGAVYESPVIESFSGQLHDAESVEVHESLPVNVFGYPTPYMEPEEFDLSSLREPSKGGLSAATKRRGRKV